MPYGIIKVDTITFTDGGADKTVSISGLVQNPTFSGNITVTGTISGNVIRGGTTVSGATVTGTAGQFGTLTGNTAGFTTITGATVTGTVAQFTTITGGTAGFTTVTGATVTGTTANFTTLSGTTVTGNAGSFTTVTGGVATITSGVFAVGAEALPSISFASDPNTGIYSPGADQVAISTGGSGRLFITSTGAVGIGGSPSSGFPFEIKAGAIDSTARFDSTNAVGPHIRFSNSGTDTHFLGSTPGFTSGGTSNDFGIRTAGYFEILTGGNNPRLRVTSAGLVGVGTSSVSRQLTVTGTTVPLRLETSDSNMAIEFVSNAGTRRNWLIGAQYNVNGGFEITPGTANGNTTFSTPAFVIDSSSRVGIGTSSPQTLLELAGNGTAIVRTTNDNPGIGQDALIGGYEFYKADASGSGVGVVGAVRMRSADSVGSSAYMTFSTALGGTANDVERVRITGAGNVGIGTTAPTSNLSFGATDAVISADTSDASDNKSVSLAGGGAGATTRGGYVQAYGNEYTTTGGVVDINSGNVANSYVRIQGRSSTSDIRFWINAAESARIDSSGRLLVGTSSARANFYNSSNTSTFQIEGTSAVSGFGRISSVYNDNSANGGSIIIGKTRGASIGAVTAVSDGDNLGNLSFQGADGTELVEAASIAVAVDGTPGANDMPGRLVFSTTADGASSPTERARITSAGYFKATNTGSYDSSTGTFHELVTSNSGSPGLKVRTTDGNYNGTILSAAADRAASSAYWFVAGVSGNGADTEFYIRGDGNAYADGSWNGGGADYAEYFEWSDSNPNEEDRRGISVVLDGDKIREAVAGEDPIGVISGNPSVVGDAAWNKWNGKHLRDEFGSYLLDENGERQLNPAYDPDIEYIPREQRPEWDCVGLMGKLRIRKGQVTGSRWIKMRDISDTVEEWLVR